jgi:hypothetical protein
MNNYIINGTLNGESFSMEVSAPSIDSALATARARLHGIGQFEITVVRKL